MFKHEAAYIFQTNNTHQAKVIQTFKKTNCERHTILGTICNEDKLRDTYHILSMMWNVLANGVNKIEE